MGKTRPTYVLPCNRCLDLANAISSRSVTDEELIAFKNESYPNELKDFERYLRTFTRGFAQICVAEEDNILWPDGPDIREYQFGGGKIEVSVINLGGPDTVRRTRWKTMLEERRKD